MIEGATKNKPVEQVHMVNARNKLKVYKGPPVEDLVNSPKDKFLDNFISLLITITAWTSTGKVTITYYTITAIFHFLANFSNPAIPNEPNVMNTNEL